MTCHVTSLLGCVLAFAAFGCTSGRHHVAYRDVQDSLLTAPRNDLRTTLEDCEVIAERERAGKCRIYVVGIPLGRMQMPKCDQEIVIPTNATVRTVLEIGGIRNWSGGQPQLRIVRRDSIVQSPLGGSRDRKEQVREFLEAAMSPGDTLIVSLVQ
jgi:hypothetical protein